MFSTKQVKIVVLQSGSIKPEVIDLQYILQVRGFNPGQTDGDFGLATEAAVKRFQRSKKLGDDGIVGLETWTAMGYAWADNQPGNFLREGDSGKAVRLMQEALLSKGMHPGTADGIFGANTKAAVIQFQKSGDRVSNIKGVVGPLTWGGILGD